MKRILVCGGAGFIGSNLIEKLIKAGNYVICLDNLYTGSLRNVEKFKKCSNFEFMKANIVDYIDIQADEIYNLACPASPVHYQNDPIGTFEASVFGVRNLLKLANKYNSTLLQASTSEIYGNPLVHPQNEEYFGNVNTIGPRSCYDEGKRAAETMMFDYKRKFNTKIKVARIFNTYGINMAVNDGRVISNFIVQALNNEDITIYGSGGQTRSFCYIDDLTDGLIKLMNCEKELHTPINLGNPVENTINEIAKLIIKKTKSNSKLIYMSLPQDDPVKRKPDISKAINILNWRPSINLNTGLDKTIDYFRKILQEK